jgi:hypothetical protein
MARKQNKIILILLAIALCVLVIGSVFRILHWHFSFELKLTSFIGIGVIYAIRYGLKQSKNIKDLAKVTMVLSWVFFSVFAMYKMNNLVFFLIILAVSGSTWLAIEVWDINLKKPKSERANVPQLMGMLFSIICYIFRIQHWPFAGPMFLISLIGLILLAIGFVVDTLELQKKGY